MQPRRSSSRANTSKKARGARRRGGFRRARDLQKYVNILTVAEERDLVAGIVQLANLLTRRLAPVFEKSNITPQQWAVLVTLADQPMSLVAAARRLGVSKQ